MRHLILLLLACCLCASQVGAAPPLPRQTYGAAPPLDTRQFYPDLIGSLTHYCISTSPANTYTCTVDHGQGLTLALTAGQLYILTVTNTNTGASTLNLNNLGAVPIKKFIATSLVDVVAGDLPAGKQIALRHDGATFQLSDTGAFPPRVVALTDAATVTPNLDTTDVGVLLTLSQTTTLANPTGTPTNGQRFLLRITSATARTLVFGTAYSTAGLALPTTTLGGGLTEYHLWAYNTASLTLDYLGSTQPSSIRVQSCGTTSTCAATTILNPQFVYGTIALVAGTATITGISPAFTSVTSFACTGTDITASNAVQIVNVSASSITLTGTGADTVGYHCVGN